MGNLSNYIFSFFNKKRFNKNISLFSSWDRSTSFSNKIYLAHGVRLNKVEVGKYTRIRHFSTIHDTEIGKFCSISRNARIGLAEHPINLISTNSLFYSDVPNELRSDWVRPYTFQARKKIQIGNDVWIGEYVSIKGGVKIGDGAIIAARAFVTKDVPPYAIVAGIPAKVVKYRFDNETIEKLLSIKWWDMEDSEIERNLDAFTITDVSSSELDKYF
jgi:acetyltransferase-like isoleucine patch superfamily enzyme